MEWPNRRFGRRLIRCVMEQRRFHGGKTARPVSGHSDGRAVAILSLKEALPNRYRVARPDTELPCLRIAAFEPLRIDAQNFISARAVTAHRHALRRRDARV